MLVFHYQKGDSWFFLIGMILLYTVVEVVVVVVNTVSYIISTTTYLTPVRWVCAPFLIYIHVLLL